MIKTKDLNVKKDKLNPKCEIKIPKDILDKANIIFTKIDKLL